mmetsp:Transcript_14947/g.31987  ORF Transcript_14947/g.31987 Transcript_14947/m.31987 type:complete len:206 (+) Transcript_14947:1100-1717(+)
MEFFQDVVDSFHSFGHNNQYFFHCNMFRDFHCVGIRLASHSLEQGLEFIECFCKVFVVSIVQSSNTNLLFGGVIIFVDGLFYLAHSLAELAHQILLHFLVCNLLSALSCGLSNLLFVFSEVHNDYLHHTCDSFEYLNHSLLVQTWCLIIRRCFGRTALDRCRSRQNIQNTCCHGRCASGQPHYYDLGRHAIGCVVKNLFRIQPIV